MDVAVDPDQSYRMRRNNAASRLALLKSGLVGQAKWLARVNAVKSPSQFEKAKATVEESKRRIKEAEEYLAEVEAERDNVPEPARTADGRLLSTWESLPHPEWDEPCPTCKAESGKSCVIVNTQKGKKDHTGMATKFTHKTRLKLQKDSS